MSTEFPVPSYEITRNPTESDTSGEKTSPMKTTLNIDDTLMRELREEAARRGTTMSALVEAGLRRVLEERAPYRTGQDTLPPLPAWHGGQTLVDIANRDALYRAMEEA